MGTTISQPVGAYVTVDPFRDIMNGIIQGAQLHDQIQRTQDEHAAMQRQQIQQTRQNRIQDIQQQMLMQSNSRPVNPDGTVTEKGQPLTWDLGNGVSNSTPMSVTRNVDPSRAVTYDLNGQSYRRELLSEPERIQQEATQRATLARSGQSDVSSLLQRMLTENAPPPMVDPGTGEVINGASMGPAAGTVGAPRQNQFPNGVYVNPGQVPAIMSDMIRGQMVPTTPEEQALGAPAFVPMQYAGRWGATQAGVQKNDANIKAKQDAVRPLKTFMDTQGRWVTSYSDGSQQVLGAGLQRLTKGSTGRQLTPDAQALSDRAQQRQQASDQSTVDKLQQQEQTLHGLRSSLGDAIAAADGTTITNPLDPTGKTKATVNALTRSLWKNKLDQATKQVSGLQATQTRLISKWGGQARGNAPGATSAPAPGQPTAGQTQTAAPAAPRPRAVDTKGNAVDWDGKSWVPVPKQ